MPNIFAGIAENRPEELLETLLGTEHIRIERIVSCGQASPPGFWYDQEWQEWVFLLEGAAAVAFDGGEEPRRLLPGDHLAIPAHRRHRVAWTAPDRPTVWLAVHFE
jgi:cupin 2 domain-containing protein